MILCLPKKKPKLTLFGLISRYNVPDNKTDKDENGSLIVGGVG
jgi:hypothetical protein